MGSEMPSDTTIGILGGTGDLGSGLAKAWARGGYAVVIGSRSAEKAEAAAGEMEGKVRGAGTADAAREADVVVLAVPFASREATSFWKCASAVQGKILVDAAVPTWCRPGRPQPSSFPAEGSAAQIAQNLAR